MPPLARAVSVPQSLCPIFRALGAINRCVYFGGWQMEDHIRSFRLKPEGVEERLARTYRLPRHSGDSMERPADEYRSLIRDIGRLFEGAFAPCARAVALRRETQRPAAGGMAGGRADPELFSVSSWLRTREDVVSLSARLSNRVYNYPSELSKYVERGALCMFHDAVRDMIGSLLEVLMFLNDVAAAPLLDLDETISSLPVHPQGAYARTLEILHCADPVDTLAPLECLLRETETMVRAKQP